MKTIGPHPDFPSANIVADNKNDCCLVCPYPNNIELADYYRSNYRTIRMESASPDYVGFMTARAKVQKDFILAQSSQTLFSKVLDIGSGCGTLINELKRNSETRSGFEPDEVMARFASEHFGDESTRFHSKLFDPELDYGRFDLISMSHVLEHVPHPGEFLSTLRIRTLASGGCIFIEVPNDPLFWVEKQIQWRLSGMAHLTYFTQKSLSALLLKSGFKILAERVCGLDLQHEISKRRPLNKAQRALRKVRRYFKPDPDAFSAPPDYSPATPMNGVYLQLLATV